MLYSRSRFSCELSEIGAAKPDGARLLREAPAAFRRLCVETAVGMAAITVILAQPPSGGCVLKRSHARRKARKQTQPPSGGCVLKQKAENHEQSTTYQPPSGGCVLKQGDGDRAATFIPQPPSGGCVLKLRPNSSSGVRPAPAAFRRLCVETTLSSNSPFTHWASRLQAAVC